MPTHTTHSSTTNGRSTPATSRTGANVRAYPAARQLATPTDLKPEEVQAVTEAVNPLIADAYALYVKTKNFHWHLSGSHFRDYHLLFDEQADATGAVPDDRTIVVERFTDEIGDWRVCVLSPFGAQVHAPWAMALQHKLAERWGR